MTAVAATAAGQTIAVWSPKLEAVELDRQMLWCNDYRPIAVASATNPGTSPGKRPVSRAWQVEARIDTPAAVFAPVTRDALNTGILCDGLRVIDIDIDDPAAAEKVYQVAIRIFGDTITRFRDDAGRVTLVYRAAEVGL